MLKEKNNTIVKTEQVPAIEITVGNEKRIPTEITFYSNGALDIKYLWEICSLLEKRGYDSSELELTSKKLDSQTIARRKEGICIYEGEKEILNYSLICDNLDGKTKNRIEDILKSIPYIKIVS